MFSKLMQSQRRSVQLTLNLRNFRPNFKTNAIAKFGHYNHYYNTRNAASNMKYILGMSGALTFTSLNSITSLNENEMKVANMKDTKTIKTTKWTEKEIMSEPENISKALKFGAAFGFGDYGHEVRLGGLSNNITFLRQMKNLIITGDTSLNDAAYAKQLMEYLKLESFDSVKVMNSAEMITDNISHHNTGVVAVSNNNDEILSDYSPISIVNESTFTSNVTMLSLIAAWFSQLNDDKQSNKNREELIDALHKLVTYAGGVTFSTKTKCIDIANFIHSKPQPQNIYILGKGFGECIAKEGVSRIKEIETSIINAQTDYMVDEIDENAAVIMLILDDENSESMLVNAKEIESMTNGRMIYITDNSELLEGLSQKDLVIEIPQNGPLTALLAIVPLQMIAYYIGINQ